MARLSRGGLLHQNAARSSTAAILFVLRVYSFISIHRHVAYLLSGDGDDEIRCVRSAASRDTPMKIMVTDMLWRDDARYKQHSGENRK